VGADGKLVETTLKGKGQPREPRQPSAAELDHAEKRRVTDQAGRIWAGTIKWMKENGKPLDADTVLQVAMANAANPEYFPNEPNVGGVVAALQGIARTQGLTHKTVTSGDPYAFLRPPGNGGTNPKPAPTSSGNGRGGRSGNPAAAKLPPPTPFKRSDVAEYAAQVNALKPGTFKTLQEAEDYLKATNHEVK
jgi:hypothetical protein